MTFKSNSEHFDSFSEKNGGSRNFKLCHLLFFVPVRLMSLAVKSEENEESEKKVRTLFNGNDRISDTKVVEWTSYCSTKI